MYRLMLLTTDGYGSIYALSPGSGIGLARVRVAGETTTAHVAAAQEAVEKAFRDLQAQGYPNAHSGSWGVSEPVAAPLPGMPSVPAIWLSGLSDTELTALDRALADFTDNLRSGRSYAPDAVREAVARLYDDVLRQRRDAV